MTMTLTDLWRQIYLKADILQNRINPWSSFYVAVYKGSQLVKQWKSSATSYRSYGQPYGSSYTSMLEYPVDKSMFINMIRIGRDGTEYSTVARITKVEVTFANRYWTSFGFET